jgi:hypothetical protein
VRRLGGAGRRSANAQCGLEEQAKVSPQRIEEDRVTLTAIAIMAQTG